MKPARMSLEEASSELDSQECAVIADAHGALYSAAFCGKPLRKGSFDECLAAVLSEMERQQFWPNIFSINERGNLALLDYKGRELQSWV